MGVEDPTVIGGGGKAVKGYFVTKTKAFLILLLFLFLLIFIAVIIGLWSSSSSPTLFSSAEDAGVNTESYKSQDRCIGESCKCPPGMTGTQPFCRPADPADPEECPEDCTKELRPVCDNLGVTHPNRCVFNIAACKARKTHSLLNFQEGPCPNPEECPKACTMELRPVCDNLGVTHPNKCAFDIAACKARKTHSLLIFQEGPCPKDPKECHKACTMEYRPICDNLGVTHPNRCAFDNAACKARKMHSLLIFQEGSCPRDPKECHKTCTMEYKPVCDNLGITHPNRCAFDIAACKARIMHSLLIFREGPCPTSYPASTSTSTSNE